MCLLLWVSSESLFSFILLTGQHMQLVPVILSMDGRESFLKLYVNDLYFEYFAFIDSQQSI